MVISDAFIRLDELFDYSDAAFECDHRNVMESASRMIGVHNLVIDALLGERDLALSGPQVDLAGTQKGTQKAAMWVYQNECNLSSARSGSESVLKRIF